MKTQRQINEKMVHLEIAINEITRAIKEDFEESHYVTANGKWEVLWAAHHLCESLTGIKLGLGELINQYYTK